MASFGNGSIANRWRELYGKDSWKGLLDPLDIDLRKSIISYGELAEATYDGFNTERRSPHAGACMYGHGDLLTSSGVAAAGHYKVTKFIYATSGLPLPGAFLLLPLPALEDVWSRESNFMGYVAVATDKGGATSSWRGAGRDATSRFNHASARDQVIEEVRRLMELHRDEETSVTVTGHSLGAALSVLNDVDIVASGANAPAGAGSDSSKPPCPVTAVVFACPRVGDRFFRSAFNSFQDFRALHVKNSGDIVPAYPPLGYVDVAVALPINTSRSPYLRWPGTVLTLRNLECYLHGVAGEQGGAGGFKLEVERDVVALVNKGAGALKDEHPVPANRWVPKNKGMVKSAQGKWELKDFEHV
ncbi:hypothetical protein SETIT_3G063700v2 [Setaria italica]|uniref:Phospholipase A1 n=1 Tax=Setaria italica TaxID=4555 RepID=A0A368QC27_SETIT|nr:hypothetical protein SETIT_3G063700v2 [Setaria italica]